jgi:creatinine amidohydrolase
MYTHEDENSSKRLKKPMLSQPDKRPLAQGDWNITYLFPHEVVEARERTGLVILPVAPIEWHGPHMAMGCDPLLAHHFSRRLAQELRCPYYPPLYMGTERERNADLLTSLGFEPDIFIEGMDFPANLIPSFYFREEIFALVLRDLLGMFLWRMRFRHVLIVNGHGAENQAGVLNRLCHELNAVIPAYDRVRWVYPGFPRSLIAGSIGHAAAEEASMLEAAWPGTVDLSRLPSDGPLINVSFAIIDGETFDGNPTPDHTLREAQDPRWHTDPDWGNEQIEQAVVEVLDDTQTWLAADLP